MLSSERVVESRGAQDAIAGIPSDIALVPGAVIVVAKGGRKGLYLIASKVERNLVEPIELFGDRSLQSIVGQVDLYWNVAGKFYEKVAGDFARERVPGKVQHT